MHTLHLTTINSCVGYREEHALGEIQPSSRIIARPTNHCCVGPPEHQTILLFNLLDFHYWHPSNGTHDTKIRM